MTTSKPVALPSSFRDPSGFVFKEGGMVYRKVSSAYSGTYSKLLSTGLYKELSEKSKLVAHEEVTGRFEGREGEVFLEPQQISTISYPYEWSFEQLKDAALLTLSIAKTAIDHGMVLKDASAYNVQFENGAPIFIDTLSFDAYEEGTPWVAYGQFCRHFLAPLWLMAHVDYRSIYLLRTFIDGIPLDYACKLLGRKRRFSLTEMVHLRMHANLQHSKAKDQGSSVSGRRISKTSVLGLLDSLSSGIKKLEWKPGLTEWGDYYNDTNYSTDSARCKAELVERFVSMADPDTVWDIGANDGTYSRLAAKHARQVVALDIDPIAVNSNYKKCKQEKTKNLLPLLMDFTNPSPSIGWACEERNGLFQRASADLVIALAVVHHLCISNNVSLERLTRFFDSITKDCLVVEFVPKSDSKVKILLSTREDVFPDYNLECFRQALLNRFDLVEECGISGSERTLLLLKKTKTPR
jgi:ribosomal protein L11 methylase PrmA